MINKLFFLSVALLFITCANKKESKVTAVSNPKPVILKKNKDAERLSSIANQLITFTKGKNYNQSVCFLVDMKQESGKNRFHIYDLQKRKIIRSALVTHGNCGENFLPEPKYGNTIGCNCSSLGKYSVGKKYYGKFGLAYKLHGLDKTNNKAFERFVVLHAHSCVPDGEVDPMPICQSNGCPTVAPGFLQALSGYIDQSEKPLLLWMFE
jgi:L,D-transpeptidase catalytic domain